jgi:hypothetical protein
MAIDFVISDVLFVFGDGPLTVLPLPNIRPASPVPTAGAIPVPLGYAAGDNG